MSARELHDFLSPKGDSEKWQIDAPDHQAVILRALSLAAAVEESQDELVRELLNVYPKDSGYADKCKRAAAALVALKAAKEKAEAERDAAFRMSKCECQSEEACANLVKAWNDLAELKRHAEAMADHMNDGIQVDVDPEDGTQSPRSEWDFVANELVAAYRAAHPKEGA